MKCYPNDKKAWQRHKKICSGCESRELLSTSRVLALRTEWAEALPELGHAALRRNLHSGRTLADLVALRRLVINQCGRIVLPVAWSERLLGESGLRHLKPIPLHDLQVIQGTPHPHSHLVLMQECVQLAHRIPEALLSTKRLREIALVTC